MYTIPLSANTRLTLYIFTVHITLLFVIVDFSVIILQIQLYYRATLR